MKGSKIQNIYAVQTLENVRYCHTILQKMSLFGAFTVFDLRILSNAPNNTWSYNTHCQKALRRNLICSKIQNIYIYFLWCWTKTKCFGKVVFHQLLTLPEYNCFVMGINKSLWNNFFVECTYKLYSHLWYLCIISYLLFRLSQIC